MINDDYNNYIENLIPFLLIYETVPIFTDIDGTGPILPENEQKKVKRGKEK